MRRWGRSILKFWEKYQRVIGFGGLAAGFIFDLFLAKRPDSVADNLLLVGYLFASASIILLLNVRRRRQATRAQGAEPLALLLLLQFCFGGLANNLLILYGKSGTLGGSLLFVGLLGAFALGNEFLKDRYGQLRFNVAIYYFLLLTYCVIAVPTFVLHGVGLSVFLLSGAASLAVIVVFLFALHVWVFRRKEKKQLREVALLVLAIFLIFDGLYFLNIIPPVPLSLKQVGIYHSLTSLGTQDAAGNLYTATYEKPAWYVFWRDTSSIYTALPGQSAYCYSAVFAPGALGTAVVHRWEKYDPAAKEWKTESLASFPISGGRANGYRGWSYVSALTEGAWRCDIETSRGQLIGRISFDVVLSSTTPLLSTTAL